MSARLVIVLAVLAAPALADDPEAAKIAALGFLAGDWSSAEGDFHAHYTSPENGVVLSYSEHRRGGRVAFFEFERFAVVEGKASLVPYPGGRPAMAFPIVEVDPEARRVVFENSENDFPTRFVYHRVADDRLVITLSDPHHGSAEEQVFDLKRAAE